jgi:hypothetical protein
LRGRISVKRRKKEKNSREKAKNKKIKNKNEQCCTPTPQRLEILGCLKCTVTDAPRVQGFLDA